MIIKDSPEQDTEYYKKKYEEASRYCMRMIEATHEGKYQVLTNPESHLGYLDVVSENCANDIRTMRRLNNFLLAIIIPEIVVLVFLLIKFLF